MSAPRLGWSPSQKSCCRPDCPPDCADEPPPGPVAAGGAPEFCCANAESVRPVDKSSVMYTRFFMMIFLPSAEPEYPFLSMARVSKAWEHRKGPTGFRKLELHHSMAL